MTEIIRIGQLEIRPVLAPADTDGAVTVFEVTIPAGARVPGPHSHDGYERGVATITPCVLDFDFFREIAAIVNAGGPPDMSAMGEVMQRHGLTPALAVA